jgi:hypothetical protein
MYCRNCGKEVIPGGEYCMNCGARPLTGTAFCPACAGSTTPLSEICVKCGTRLAPQTPAASVNSHKKSKTASILLAIFLGFWTWLYTYKKDGWKFWTGLLVSLALGIAFIVWLFVAVSDGMDNGYFDFNTESSVVVFLVIYGSVIVVDWGINIWAIIDTAIKKSEWYDRYPDVK